MKEIWKTIQDHPDYKISNLGRVKSFMRNEPKILTPNLHKQGYWVYELNSKQYRKADLIAQYFINNPNNKPVVNHKDGNRSNDNLSNLEWTTQSENTLHGWYENDREGLVGVNMLSKSGEFIKSFKSVSLAGREMNINKAHITSTCRGRIKSAGGYKWEYSNLN